MSPTRIILACELEVGEWFVAAETAHRVQAVTPVPHGTRVNFEGGSEITFPDNAEVLIRDGAVR